MNDKTRADLVDRDARIQAEAVETSKWDDGMRTELRTLLHGPNADMWDEIASVLCSNLEGRYGETHCETMVMLNRVFDRRGLLADRAVPEPDAVEKSASLTAEQRTELIGELEEMLWMHASHIEADWYSIVWNAVLPVVEKWLAAGDGLQREIAVRAREMFGESYGYNDLFKLFEEVEELKRAAYTFAAESVAMNDPSSADVANESADVMHMLFQLADSHGFDLLEETRKKFEINKVRTGEPQPDGTYQHVTESKKG